MLQGSNLPAAVALSGQARPATPDSFDPGQLGRILGLVAAARNVTMAELLCRTRARAEAALARQMAMYLSHVVLGLTLTDIGRVFSRDRTTAAHACAVIEDRRDDPGFEFEMRCLEEAARPFDARTAASRRGWAK
jgi:hypothetical protein